MTDLSAADKGTHFARTGMPQGAMASMLAALALAETDPVRGWTEMETLLENQWPDGMVPHLIYHQPSEAFPADSLWVTGRPVTTSGLTVPPLAGMVLLRLHRAAPDPRAAALVAAVDRWHGWFGTHRDPEGEGLAAILHPWESARSDATDWAEPFAQVPTEGVAQYLPEGAGPDQARAVWLIERFRSLGWETAELHNGSPFCVVDPGLNAVLIRSCEDLATVAEELGDAETAASNRERAVRMRAALENLAEDGRYLPLDRISGRLIGTASAGTVLPKIAGLPVTAEALGPVEPWVAFLLNGGPALPAATSALTG
ncbi:MGH1-like glycoside hydrolase domain-containing protein [Falsirhodobacter xinxiangensis]|uniref:MGH1-like glycoside hydrolase domain-containing protein n=1 Tax=Falsirhodobacter xinxiangensis TaxID=2530049 RepID=UPI0010AA9080|nr:hypothetical protein [Rhodobacter xinxiangensis]